MVRVWVRARFRVRVRVRVRVRKEKGLGLGLACVCFCLKIWPATFPQCHAQDLHFFPTCLSSQCFCRFQYMCKRAHGRKMESASRSEMVFAFLVHCQRARAGHLRETSSFGHVVGHFPDFFPQNLTY